MDMKEAIKEFLEQEAGQATATEIADAFGFNRQNVSSLLNNDVAFVRLPKQGKVQPYGLRVAQRVAPSE